jgi:hypothetical protein
MHVSKYSMWWVKIFWVGTKHPLAYRRVTASVSPDAASWAADRSTSLLSLSTNTVSPKKRKESDILSFTFASALPHNPPFTRVRTSIAAWCSTLFWRNYSKVLMCRISRICWRNDFNVLINKALRVVRIHGQQSESKDSKSSIQSSRTRSNPRSKIGTSSSIDMMKMQKPSYKTWGHRLYL